MKNFFSQKAPDYKLDEKAMQEYFKPFGVVDNIRIKELIDNEIDVRKSRYEQCIIISFEKFNLPEDEIAELLEKDLIEDKDGLIVSYKINYNPKGNAVKPKIYLYTGGKYFKSPNDFMSEKDANKAAWNKKVSDNKTAAEKEKNVQARFPRRRYEAGGELEDGGVVPSKGSEWAFWAGLLGLGVLSYFGINKK